MATNPNRLSELFVLAAELATARGAAPLNKHLGCFEMDVGKFHLSLNGHNVPRKDSRGVEVPPFNLAIHQSPDQFFSFLGFVSPYDGVLIGGTEAENDVIEALKAAGRLVT